MKTSKTDSLTLCFTTLWATAMTASAEPPSTITLHYYERPPFHYSDEHGVPTGLIVARTVEIFNKAKIDYSWHVTPANRILAVLKSDTGLDCTSGWYKLSEREKYARFSEAIYRDKPLVGLSRADFRVSENITAQKLFHLPNIRLLLKENFSQGAYMDRLLSDVPKQRMQRVTAEVPTMVKMLKANRADLIITTEEESKVFISNAGYTEKEIRILRFPDVPAVENRYILCSKSVPDSTMKRLNQAILQSPPQHSQ